MPEKGFHYLMNKSVNKISKYCEQYGKHPPENFSEDSELPVILTVLKHLVYDSFLKVVLGKKVAIKQAVIEMNELINLINSYVQEEKVDSSILDPFSAVLALLLFVEDTRVAAYDALLKVFIKYDSQRFCLFLEIHSILKTLHNENVRFLDFQIVTSLILSFLQSIPVWHVSELKLRPSISNLQDSFAESIQEVKNLVSAWIHGFLVVSASVSSKIRKFETRYVILLKQFLKSLISFIENMEYVSSVFVLLMILHVLCALMIDKKNPLSIRKLSLEQIILVCNNLKSLKTKSKEPEDVVNTLKNNHPEILDDLSNNVSREKNENEWLSSVGICLNKYFISYLTSSSKNSTICPAYFYAMSIPSNIPNKVKGKRKLSEMNSDNTNIREINFWFLKMARNNLENCKLSELEATNIHLCSLFSSFKLESRITQYLRQVILMAADEANGLRLSVIKSMNLMIENNTDLLFFNPLKVAIRSCIVDISPLVRESILNALDKIVLVHLSGKYMPIFLDNFDHVTTRLLDVNINVRKAALSLVTRLCVENRENCVVKKIIPKILGRITDDDDTIKNLTIETFHILWFMDEEKLFESSVILEIIELSCNDLNHFEVLMSKITVPILECSTANKNCFVNLKYENRMQLITDCFKNVLVFSMHPECNIRPENRIPVYYIIAKFLPELLKSNFKEIAAFVLEHIKDLNSYEVKMNSLRQMLRIMESMVNVTKGKDEFSILYAVIESVNDQIAHLKLNVFMDVLKFHIMCIKSLPGFENDITKLGVEPYDQLKKYFNSENSEKLSPTTIDKCVYTLGILTGFFDSADLLRPFVKVNLREYLCDSICSLVPAEVTPTMIKTLGLICIKDENIWKKANVQQLYLNILKVDCNLLLKIEVIQNMMNILLDEEKTILVKSTESGDERFNWQDEKLTSKTADATSIQSVVVDVFLMPSLKLYLNTNVKLRICIAKLCNFLCRKLLINPTSIMSHLICMLSDVRIIKSETEQTLNFIIERYPTFINSSLHEGIELCCALQSLEKKSDCRGYGITNSAPVAVFSSLYTAFQPVLKEVFVQALLQEFEKKNPSLQHMIFVADNLAYFPYKSRKELNFVLTNVKVLSHAVDLISDLAVKCGFTEHSNGSHDIIADLEEGLMSHANHITSKWSDHWLFKSNVCIIMMQLRKHLRKLVTGYSVRMRPTADFLVLDTVKFWEQSKDYLSDKKRLIPIMIKTYLQILLDEESNL